MSRNYFDSKGHSILDRNITCREKSLRDTAPTMTLMKRAQTGWLGATMTEKEETTQPGGPSRPDEPHWRSRFPKTCFRRNSLRWDRFLEPEKKCRTIRLLVVVWEILVMIATFVVRDGYAIEPLCCLPNQTPVIPLELCYPSTYMRVLPPSSSRKCCQT